jgi:hypothetical protein
VCHVIPAKAGIQDLPVFTHLFNHKEEEMRGMMQFILVPSLIVTMILVIISAVQAAS